MYEQNVFQGPGTGTFSTHTAEIIIMLLGAFLIGLWFGWVLWSRYRQAAERLRLDNESLNATATALRGEVEGLKTRLHESETERSTLTTQVQNLNWELENLRSQRTVMESDLAKIQERNRLLESELGLAGNPDPETPFEVTAPLPQDTHDDLPDLEDAIAEAVENTFDAAQVDLPELETAVTEAVAAAVSERRDETVELPTLEEKKAPSAPAAPETVVHTVVSGPRDDLKIVEGIGPKIEELLFKAGITTYGQLAATSVQQLKDILTEAGPRFAMHDPGTWSAQALLAANGEWENLKAYQDFLNAGKRPEK